MNGPKKERWKETEKADSRQKITTRRADPVIEQQVNRSGSDLKAMYDNSEDKKEISEAVGASRKDIGPGRSDCARGFGKQRGQRKKLT